MRKSEIPAFHEDFVLVHEVESSNGDSIFVPDQVLSNRGKTIESLSLNLAMRESAKRKREDIIASQEAQYAVQQNGCIRVVCWEPRSNVGGGKVNTRASLGYDFQQIKLKC